METSEYIAKFKEIQDTYDLQTRSLRQVYALSKNKYHIGDILIGKDNIIIRVEKIGVTYLSLWNSIPHCNYEGVLLNLDFTDRKDNARYRIQQPDVIKRISGMIHARDHIGKRKNTPRKPKTQQS